VTDPEQPAPKWAVFSRFVYIGAVMHAYKTRNCRNRPRRELYLSGIYAGQAPFVGKIAVPETEYLLCAADAGGTGEIYAHLVPVLIL